MVIISSLWTALGIATRPGSKIYRIDPRLASGTRHTRDALRRWFERLSLLFTELHFEVKEVTVQGWPWKATVMVQWENQERARDGQPYANQGTHVVRLRRGRVIYLHEHLDSQRVAEVCRRLVEQGGSEVAAEPITD